MAANARAGGVAAVRGFAYQFDQTLLAALERPTETIEVEHIEDLNGVDWCIQVKQYSGDYKPSVLTKAVRGLWRLHCADPSRRLRLHCHFPDKSSGSVLPLTPTTMPSIWRTALNPKTSAPSDHDVGKFLERLEVRFTEDLESQFDDLLERLRSVLSLKSREDAICTHAIFRAHVLSLATKTSRAARQLSLAQLKALDRNHRAAVLDCGYIEHIGDERYIQLVIKRFFKKTFNFAPANRIFVVDVEPSSDIAALADLAVKLSGRYFKRLRTGPKGVPPVLCIRGLPVLDHQRLVGRIYDALERVVARGPASRTGHRDLPLVDGHPYHGSPFRPALLTAEGPPVTLLRLIPPDALDHSDLAAWVGQADQIVHFWTEDRNSLPWNVEGTTRINVRNIEMLSRILT